MENNIVSFEKYIRARDERVRKRAIDGIDREEVHRYYTGIIDVSIRHLTLLQRYFIEEYLAEIIVGFFLRGVDASKQYRTGRTTEDIEHSYTKDHFLEIYSLANDYRLSRHIGEWDLYSVSIIAEDLSLKWFRNGLAYGKRQRKLKLL
ncbi:MULTISPECIES: hypothetical protein [Aneurinibacillus]|jgi:hypothetical protein|uniref:Uncharacterized protein n=1 Tax=Aneurinibacillus danicus TaxID=267746 RepID=A0A511VC61_9BACL|nr:MULTISPECIES: hypothetical protein [Aneurinibacillus]GEN34822.1 hypothetical protein ADA01nite_22820 [Aneurinibacillus danicus]